MTICVPYFSENGHCARLAQTIARGAQGRACDITKLTATDWEDMRAAPAIIMVSPTYMGSVAARFGQFLEDAAAEWPDHEWHNKIAAGATCGCHPSGDKLQTLTRMAIFAAQMGMIWVGSTLLGAPVREGTLNRDGAWLGFMATDAGNDLLSAADLKGAEDFGARIRWATTCWTP